METESPLRDTLEFAAAQLVFVAALVHLLLGVVNYQWNPSTIGKLQQAAQADDYDAYLDFAEIINDQQEHPQTLRGLLALDTDGRESIPVEEVEPVEDIVERFFTASMSFGSLSKEAHETLAIAMNRIGGTACSGEGGDPERLCEEFDAVCLAVGAQKQRDLALPGRDLDGVRLAMPYLKQANRRQAGEEVTDPVHAAEKNVVVLGGGDTGADCVATAHRQGARQVVQIGINERPPDERPPDNPWPEQPKTYRKTYAQEEGGSEEFGVDTQAFVDGDGDGRVDRLDAERVEWSYDEDGRRAEKTVVDPDFAIPADLALIAVGFEGPSVNPFADLGVERGDDGTVETDDRKMSAVERVFAAGDATRGQSLVVWAIGEGRDAARHVDAYLTEESDLPPSLETQNPPLL